MLRGMDTRRDHTGLDRQIETLLDRINESSSIVDRLLEMPLPSTDDADALPDWDLAAIAAAGAAAVGGRARHAGRRGDSGPNA